ncbi:hypothetical protein Thiowin_00543 [Thiorhodovibrio winogradskyi]|uniref:Uncharacterized protein n=1 Tax=Thiorhodovibrio winogradskyi TaxID=77007 RepID=A0ABZ0S512_9GAMM|nr:hypothetical protein [Thiorhodovibrio winogradskyi]
MEFIPAGEIIGERHQVRSVRIEQSPQLPDGEYAFIDMYCSDPNCDCRKTMIHVLHNGQHVSTINYGWESKSFYAKWMNDSKENSPFPPMHGASIDLTSPNRVSADGILGLFNHLLSDVWIAKFKQHDKAVKAAFPAKAT